MSLVINLFVPVLTGANKSPLAPLHKGGNYWLVYSPFLKGSGRDFHELGNKSFVPVLTGANKSPLAPLHKGGNYWLVYSSLFKGRLGGIFMNIGQSNVQQDYCCQKLG